MRQRLHQEHGRTHQKSGEPWTAGENSAEDGTEQQDESQHYGDFIGMSVTPSDKNRAREDADPLDSRLHALAGGVKAARAARTLCFASVAEAAVAIRWPS